LFHGPEGRRWITYQAMFLDSSDFVQLGGDFERSFPSKVHIGQVAGAAARLFSIPEAVAFDEECKRRNRTA